MAEKLTLAVPVTPPATVEWEVIDIFLSKEAPAIKVTLLSNTGERYVYRAIPSETVPASQILAGLSFINQGKFMVQQGKSLQKWLLDRISAEGVKVGSVSGVPD